MTRTSTGYHKHNMNARSRTSQMSQFLEPELTKHRPLICIVTFTSVSSRITPCHHQKDFLPCRYQLRRCSGWNASSRRLPRYHVRRDTRRQVRTRRPSADPPAAKPVGARDTRIADGAERAQTARVSAPHLPAARQSQSGTASLDG